MKMKGFITIVFYFLLHVLSSSIILLVYQCCLLGAALSTFSIIGDECVKVTVLMHDQ